jgi:exonuclease SbcD
MRFLHTADWHVGKQLRGRSRLDEYEAVLEEILVAARRERVDCLLVAGDLFDSQAPPAEAERLVYNFFAELVGSGIPAVVIGGNHDHPRRLAALRELLDSLKIYVRAEPCRPADGGLIGFSARGEQASIVALPFVTESRLVNAAKLMAPEDVWYAEYSSRLAAIVNAMCADFSSRTVNILIAHLYVDGAECAGSERAIHLAHPYAVPAPQFPPSIQYAALGHLHRPQHLTGPCPLVYSGSPLVLDFGEQGQEKRIVLVDCKPGKPAHIESIPLAGGRKLRDIAGTFEEL